MENIKLPKEMAVMFLDAGSSGGHTHKLLMQKFKVHFRVILLLHGQAGIEGDSRILFRRHLEKQERVCKSEKQSEKILNQKKRVNYIQIYNQRCRAEVAGISNNIPCHNYE